MTNFFAVLGVPPRPMLDVAQLNDLYGNKSKAAHSDRAEDSDLATLNEAFRTLSDPVSRVWHLLAISGDEPQSVTASAEIDGWFGQLAIGLQRFDRLLQPLLQETSSLLRAVKIREVQPAMSELERLEGELTHLKEGRLQAMAQIDSRWAKSLEVADFAPSPPSDFAPSPPLASSDELASSDKLASSAKDRASLAQIACDLRFIEKWLAQIAERRLRLACIAE